MSDTTPHDYFADLEALWQQWPVEPVSAQLAARWQSCLRAELANEQQGEPSWFLWAVAATIVLGLHLNLALSNSAPVWGGTERMDLATLERDARERDERIARLAAGDYSPIQPGPPHQTR